MFKMNCLVLLVFFIYEALGLKTWIHNTGVNSAVNWDEGSIPKNCDTILFPAISNVASFWNIEVKIIIFEF